jgi:hypothetical protein
MATTCVRNGGFRPYWIYHGDHCSLRLAQPSTFSTRRLVSSASIKNLGIPNPSKCWNACLSRTQKCQPINGYVTNAQSWGLMLRFFLECSVESTPSLCICCGIAPLTFYSLSLIIISPHQAVHHHVFCIQPLEPKSENIILCREFDLPTLVMFLRRRCL